MVCLLRLKLLQKWSVINVIAIVIIVVFCIYIHVLFMRNIIGVLQSMTKFASEVKEWRNISSSLNMKYILVWDSYYLIKTTEGVNVFPTLKCSVTSCVFTLDRDLLQNDYTNFDAILFHETHLKSAKGRPTRRVPSQIYIFSTIESSSNYPACGLYNDDFFNWTFTHRLDSDVVWNYFVVRNAVGNIVAPSINVQWIRNKYPVDEKIKAVLQGRTRAAAWIVSNCKADSFRNEYLTKLQEHLFHYALEIDVYGSCTGRKCDDDNCEEMLRKNHYFYMAFENSIVDDYVTEKVLHGYNNYVVPIVFGGANYSRFLPPGSYINARDYHPYNLAYIMYEAIKNPSIYESYFRWTNFYTIDTGTKVYHPLCNLCEALNGDKANYAPVKKNFRVWWNTRNGMKWCLPNEYWNETVNMNLDGRHIYKNFNLYL